MDSAFSDLLVHPVSKSPLQFDAATNTLVDKTSGDAFVVKQNVPVLLPPAAEQPQPGGFNYLEHYQTDAETYDYFSESENKIEAAEIKRLHNYILSEVPASASWVLDTGCGGGWLAAALKSSGKHVISMDISDINPIRAVHDIAYPTHHGLVADVFHLPIKENSIDCIVASEIIEHLVDPKKFLQALLKALKPGGKIIVTTPYNERIPKSLCIHCNHLTPHNAHLHSFTEASMQRYLPDGFRSQKMTVFNNKILVRTGLQRLLGFLPLPLYRLIDSLFNKLFKKRSFRLMLVIEK